jgi:CDP-diacylglycerol---glycerol-3-phosphate 3-phosphatidyltransferase
VLSNNGSLTTEDFTYWQSYSLNFSLCDKSLLILLSTAFYMEDPWAATATTGIFLAAAVTDWLDGYIARKVSPVWILFYTGCYTNILGSFYWFLTYLIITQMQLGTPFGAFLDPVADKVSFPLCCPDLKNCLSRPFLHIYKLQLRLLIWKMSYPHNLTYAHSLLQLMVAATLVLLCTKPLETSLLMDGPWILTVPSIAIIGREVITLLIYLATSQKNGETVVPSKVVLACNHNLES